MTSLPRHNVLFAALAAVPALALILVGPGCSGGDEEPVAAAPVAPVAPPAPPAPVVTSVASLIDQLGIDERITMEEDDAPDGDAARRAVLEFFDAFARADAQALRERMTLADQLELDVLVESGALDQAADETTRIELVTGRGPYGQDCVIAVFEIGDGYQPQMWYYDEEAADLVFEAALTPPNMVDRVHGSDWIGAWHDVLDAEMALADEPDESFDVAQRNLDGGGTAGAGPAAPPSRPAAPVGPGPGRFDPK
ncbi:MAG: hypothetical protein ACYTG1_02040 [Planctomycetota bacterium]|jgi:hypothetical protein